MIILKFCWYFSWSLLLRASDTNAAAHRTKAVEGQCDAPQFKTHVEQCRLFTLCIEPKKKGDPLKEYLFACPYGANFNLFLFSCYDFQQECALEKGPEVDEKLTGALQLTIPKKRQSCKGAHAPFCSSENILTVCHPWSESVMGYADCDPKRDGKAYCDKEEANCALKSISNRLNASNADYLQRTVVLCSRTLKDQVEQKCFDIFGKEFLCANEEDTCPLYFGELLSLSARDIPSLLVNVQVQTLDANATVETIVKTENSQNLTKNEHHGEILTPKIKLHACQTPGGSCLSDRDTYLICSNSLRILQIYRCSLVYGNSSECLSETKGCITYSESPFISNRMKEVFGRSKRDLT